VPPGTRHRRLKPVLSEWAVPAAAALYALYPTALESDPRAQQFVDFLAANIVPALALPKPARAPAAQPGRTSPGTLSGPGRGTLGCAADPLH